MNIAFVSREYPPDSAWGGIAIVYYDLAYLLAQRGHEVHVICQAVNQPADYLERGVIVHRVGTDARRYSARARINYSFHAWRKLNELVRNKSIELVEATHWGAEGFFCSLFLDIPLVVSSNISAQNILRTKTFSGAGEFVSLKTLSFLEDFTARKADRIVANSRATYDMLLQQLRIPAHKVDLVHHAVDTTRFKFIQSDIKSKLRLPDTVPMVMSTGRLELRKGTHILCQAIPHILRHHPDTKFVLLGRDTETAPGGGSFKKYITGEAQKNNFSDNLTFLDFVSEDELVQLYSACDVFVSSSFQESFGLTVIEAMACGRQVVATPVGIVPELASFGLKGLSIVPVGDYQKLAEAVIHFLSYDKKLISELAHENRQMVENNFSFTEWIEKMLMVYKKTTGVCYLTED
jgi:glycosyltransferase involved in cell wall biosynthesis